MYYWSVNSTNARSSGMSGSVSVLPIVTIRDDTEMDRRIVAYNNLTLDHLILGARLRGGC